MAAHTTSFTVRLEPSDHDTLVELAEMRGTSPAELARDMILAGFPEMLDPKEIEDQIEKEKQRLLAAAAAIRKRREAKVKPSVKTDA